MSKYTEIRSAAEFDRLVRANKVVVADFHATWCGPCKVIAPVFEQLATSHSSAGRLAFAKIDTDQNPDVTSKYGVSAMPTFLIFKNGSVSDTIRGANASALRAAVSSAVADASRGEASSGPNFETKGYRLGGADEAAKKSSSSTTIKNSTSNAGRTTGGSSSAGYTTRSGVAGGAGAGMSIPSLGGAVDGAVRFAALYFTTLFSFDAYAAADSSPFSVKNKRR